MMIPGEVEEQVGVVSPFNLPIMYGMYKHAVNAPDQIYYVRRYYCHLPSAITAAAAVVGVLNKILNASRPSEHPLGVRGENVKTFRWHHRSFKGKTSSSWHLNGFPDGSSNIVIH